MCALYLRNQTEDCPTYVDVNPYDNGTKDGSTTVDKYYISVNSKNDYANTYANISYNTTNDLFAEFLVNKVFKIYKSSDSVAAYSDYSKNTDGTNYMTPASINSVNTHLAGTILAFKISPSSSYSHPGHFNCALIMEETFSLNGSTLEKASSVDIRPRLKEQIMQTLYSTTGIVYDFKKGVKISDFMDNMEQRKTSSSSYLKGFYDFRYIPPTNKSTINVTESEIKNPTIPSSPSTLYTLSTTAPKKIDVDADENESPEESDATYSATTNFTGYFVMCSFGIDTTSVTTADGLILCKPYLNIFRIVNSKVVHTYYTDIYTSTTAENNCIIDHIVQNYKTAADSKVTISFEDIGIDIPLNEMLSQSDLESTVGSAVETNFYVLNVMKTS